MELLIKAGYQDDPHIKNGFRWLLPRGKRIEGGLYPLELPLKI
jgi:hypothetical protein